MSRTQIPTIRVRPICNGETPQHESTSSVGANEKGRQIILDRNNGTIPGTSNVLIEPSGKLRSKMLINSNPGKC